MVSVAIHKPMLGGVGVQELKAGECGRIPQSTIGLKKLS